MASKKTPIKLTVAEALAKTSSAGKKKNDLPSTDTNNTSEKFEITSRKVTIEPHESTTPKDPAPVVDMPETLARILENLENLKNMQQMQQMPASNDKNLEVLDAIPQPLTTTMPESPSKILSELPKQEEVVPPTKYTESPSSIKFPEEIAKLLSQLPKQQVVPLTRHTESPPSAQVPDFLAKILADLAPQQVAGAVESKTPPIINISNEPASSTPPMGAILNFLKEIPQPFKIQTPSPSRVGGNVISITPSGGDLVVMTQTQQLLVSSTVLSCASPIIAGMIVAPRSQAGMGLCGDPTAVYILVALLHHRLDLIPPSMNSGLLKSIAEVVGRYQLRPALGQWPEHWMSVWTENSTEWKDWLVVAYVFQNSTMFRWASKMAVLHYTTDTSADKKDAEGRLLVTDKDGASRLFVGGIPLDCSTEFLTNIFKSRGFRV
jgi:hypothetical protein